MKKIAFLTSVLALAACGGGSGGVDAPNRSEPLKKPTVPSTVTADAVASNKEVTGMVSEILIAEDDDASANTGRTSSHHINGKKYTSYKLDDVDFNWADEGFGGELKFVLDEKGTGKIERIEFIGGDDDEDDNDDNNNNNNDNNDNMAEVSPDDDTDDEDIGKFARINGNKFHGKVDVGETDATYSSMGNKLGLKYSDFGLLHLHVIDGWAPVFIGGYDVKRIKDIDKVDSTMTFSGSAVGSVVAVHENGVAAGGDDEQTVPAGKGLLLNKDGEKNAKLVFDSGKETLTADFANWYNVEYEKGVNDKDGEYRVITFTPGSDQRDEKYYLINDAKGEGKTVKFTNGDQVYKHSDGSIASIDEDIRYYGDNGRADEVVGIMQFRDCGATGCTDEAEKGQADEVRMNLGFGGKRDK